jgi:hypothetical protein
MRTEAAGNFISALRSIGPPIACAGPELAMQFFTHETANQLAVVQKSNASRAAAMFFAHLNLNALLTSQALNSYV